MKYSILEVVVFLIAIYLSNYVYNLISRFKANSVWRFPEDYHEYATIETESGQIRGQLHRSLFDQKYFYSFRGVPFAKPPVEKLRFKVKAEF